MKYVKSRLPLEKVFFRLGGVSSALESSFTQRKLLFCARRFLALPKKSKFLKASSRIFVCLSVVIFVGGCANNSGPSLVHNDNERLPLINTDQFLPVQERDELGQLLPYEAAPNPYANLKGRISKTAVAKYIDARRAFAAQQYDLAEKTLSELVIEEPKLSGPWVMRGDIASLQDKLDIAVEYYATAIEVNTVNFNAYLRLAKAQRQQGHFTHAQNTYALALSQWPDGPELHLNLGVLYDLYLNQPLQAQAHMEAYQLLHKDTNQEVLAWLDEIRQRTGVASTLKVIGADGELELITDARIDSESSLSETNPNRTQKLSVSDIGGE